MSLQDPLVFEPGDRILVSRTDRLGDLILALPFVETLSQRYPECEVDVLASLYASPILEGNPCIERILRVQNDQLRLSKAYEKDFVRRLTSGGYKAVVVLLPERRVSYLFHKTAIPIRIGTAGRFHSFLFNYHLLHSRKANKKHESEYNMEFLRFFKDGPTETMPHVYPREKELRNAARIVRQAGVTGPYAVVHPLSGRSAEPWPVDSFLRLCVQLERDGVEVVVSGSEEEGRLLADRLSVLDLRARLICGETDLRTLAAVLSRASVVVSNSTGPLHLAVSVGTQVIGLYPSEEAVSPRRWGPLGRGSRVIQPIQEGDSMDSISVERVAREVEELYFRILKDGKVQQ
jgi:ADP-heptose:LPS heptosyltransferase